MRLVILLYVSLFFTLNIAKADFPKNDLNIPVSEFSPSAIAKSSFTRAINDALRVYGPIVKRELGCELKIEGDWEDGTVNAFASRPSPDVCLVKMFGGFARYLNMNTPAFMGVICHEIGHHIAGEPTYPTSSWKAACEGQSDYFAQTCLTTFFTPSTAKQAGLILAGALASLAHDSKVPTYETPDKSVVTKTYCAHPKAQCRADTYMAGIMGLERPLCWFKP